MRTRSQARKRRQQQVRQTSVESPNLEKPNNNQETFNPPIVTMADNRTMAQLLEAPTEGYEDAIVSKSKVRQSRSKAVIAKVSTSSSTPEVSSDVAELKDMVRALILDKKNQTPAIAPVKAVEQNCVTCGGGHSYQNCPATDGNVYRDNIQEYVSQAAVVNYNQGNASYRPQMINQPPTFQAPPYQAPAPAPPAPGVSKSDFDNYVKANDAEMENEPEVTKDTVQPSTENIQPPVVQTDDQIGEPVLSVYHFWGLEELLSVINSDLNLPPSPVCEINVPEKITSSCEDPPDLELKDLPSYLEYAFLEGDDKLPVIIAKNLKDEDKTALIKVLKSHKHAIAWKISDIKGIDPQFYTHKILMEENAQTRVQ
ncbi:hypothetical protein Tco_0179694 [Tanacetum coccineum]